MQMIELEYKSKVLGSEEIDDWINGMGIEGGWQLFGLYEKDGGKGSGMWLVMLVRQRQVLKPDKPEGMAVKG